jgi:hypothetical protein
VGAINREANEQSLIALLNALPKDSAG